MLIVTLQDDIDNLYAIWNLSLIHISEPTRH